MALLELDPEAAAALIADYPEVTLAVYASPRQTVIAGPPEQVDARDRGGGRPGPAGAAHRGGRGVPSPHHRSDTAGVAHRAFGFGAAPRRRSRSSPPPATRPARRRVFDADYWVANLRNPVRFSQAIAAAGADHATFIEVSPHPLLTYAISDTLGPRASPQHRNPAARHPRHAHFPHQPQHRPHHPPHRAPHRRSHIRSYPPPPGTTHSTGSPSKKRVHAGRICAQIRHPARRAHRGRQHTARTPVAGAAGAGGQAVSGFPSNPRRGSGADIGSAADPFGSSCRMWRIDIV